MTLPNDWCISRSQFVTEQYIQQQICFNHCHDVIYPLPCWRGSGSFRSVYPRRGMLLVMEEYELDRNMWTVSDSIPRSLNFSYCISGRVIWSIDGMSEKFTTRKGECEIMLSCNTIGRGRYEPGEPLIIVNIILCADLLQSFFDPPGEGSHTAQALRLPELKEGILYRKRSITNTEQTSFGAIASGPLVGAWLTACSFKAKPWN